MRDVCDFNRKYLESIVDMSLSGHNKTATTLNVELSQVAELARLPDTSLVAISSSTVCIAEITCTLESLNSNKDFESSQTIKDLNYKFLNLVRHLAVKDERIAFLSTRCDLVMLNKIKSMTAKEIKLVAASNPLMFRCTLSIKALIKAQSHNIANNLYLKYLPVMSMRLNEIGAVAC